MIITNISLKTKFSKFRNLNDLINTFYTNTYNINLISGQLMMIRKWIVLILTILLKAMFDHNCLNLMIIAKKLFNKVLKNIIILLK